MGYTSGVKWDYQLVKEYFYKLGYELLSNEYINCKQKLVFKDQYGYLYYGNFDNIIHRQKTPNKISKYNPYAIQNIKLWCKLNNKPFELLSEKYSGNNINLQWQCLKDDCGEIFNMSWNCIQRGLGCAICAGRQVGISNCLATKNPDLAKQWHPTLNGDLTPYDITCGSSKYVWWLCEKGHEWLIDVANRSCGNNCPYCSGKLPTEDYNLLICNPKLCSEWDYNKNNKKPEEYCPNSGKYAHWKCKECGYEWEAIIESRNIGNGCPKCNFSKGEKIIESLLIQYNIYNISQHKFEDCKYKKVLKFDFYLLNYNLIIEYQGIQHYEPIEYFGGEVQFILQQKLDQIKRDYCKNNNIKLIEIPYWDFDNIEEIIIKELNLNDIKIAI